MGDELRVQLRAPVQIGKKSEPVTELVMKPTGRALRDLTIMVGVDNDGRQTMFKMEPYELTRVGLRMAGISSDTAFVDLMDARDVFEVGNKVFGFFVSGASDGETSGPTDSESSP